MFLERFMNLIIVLGFFQILILIKGAILKRVIFFKNNIVGTELGVDFILFERMFGDSL